MSGNGVFSQNENCLTRRQLYLQDSHKLETVLRPCRVPILKRQMQHLLLNILLVRLYCAFKKQPLKPTKHLPIFVT